MPPSRWDDAPSPVDIPSRPIPIPSPPSRSSSSSSSSEVYRRPHETLRLADAALRSSELCWLYRRCRPPTSSVPVGHAALASIKALSSGLNLLRMALRSRSEGAIVLRSLRFVERGDVEGLRASGKGPELVAEVLAGIRDVWFEWEDRSGLDHYLLWVRLPPLLVVAREMAGLS